MNIADINFRRTCCGAHGLRAEYIRDDGVGFLIRADLPEEITPLQDLQYSVRVYEPDHKTLRSEHSDISADALVDLIEI